MRTTHEPVGVEAPMTIVMLVFDSIEHEDTLTPQTKAEQFCELGKKFVPVMKTVALG